MIALIRDDKKLSYKAEFIVQLVKLNTNQRLLYVFRKNREKFRERWGTYNIELATSTSGIFLDFLLGLFMKSPKNLHDGVIRRIYRRKNLPVIRKGDYVSTLSQAMVQYFARSARTDRLLRFLKKLNSSKTFLIDGFFSLNVVDLKIIASLGSIVYVSTDLAYDFYKSSTVASNLMYKFEQDKLDLIDLIIACSERDKLKYLKMGAKKVVDYPNIYPVKEYEPVAKDTSPSISIVLRGYWGIKADRSLEEILEKVLSALGCVNSTLKVYVIGKKPKNVPKNIDLHCYGYIPSRLSYMQTLGKSWVGINIGVHPGGSNRRKYDYAMAGLVILSDKFGVRGDLLPHEYGYYDTYDLAAKLEQLLILGKEKIEEMGMENRKHALLVAENKIRELQRTIKTSLFMH